MGENFSNRMGYVKRVTSDVIDQAGVNFRARKDAGMLFTTGGILQTFYDNFGPFSGNVGLAPVGGVENSAARTFVTTEGYLVPMVRTLEPTLELAPALALSSSVVNEPQKGGTKPNDIGSDAEQSSGADKPAASS